jgi:cytochrome c oxidase assembly protein subunit 15
MIVAGGMVTSMNAGDSVPDWPLSYGSLLPKMVGNVFWEHGHRLIGMALGLFVIALTVLVYRREPRRWVRRVTLAGLIAVCLQGALGGLRVKIISSPTVQQFFFDEPTGAQVEMLRTGVAIVHTALAQSILGLFGILAVATSRSWLRVRPAGSPAACISCGYDLRGHGDRGICPECARPAEAPIEPIASAGTGRLRALATITLGMVFLQILLGALRRQTDGTIIPHLVGAGLVVIHVVLLVRRILADFAEVRAIASLGMTLLLVVSGQVVLGISSWLLTADAIVNSLHLPQIAGSAELASAVLTAHLALGAATLAICVLIVARARHDLIPVAPPGEERSVETHRVVTA